MKDNIGVTTIKIQNLYKDKTLTGRELRKRTKEILNEFKNEELEHNRQYIKKLQISADELQTIKRILS
jgi:thiaminase